MLPLQGAQVLSLVRELRSLMLLHGAKNKLIFRKCSPVNITSSQSTERRKTKRIQSLVRELRSCMLGIGKQKENKPEFIHDKKSCHNRNRGTASIFDSGYSLGKADLFKEAFLMV